MTKSIGTRVLTITPKNLLNHGTKYNLIIHTDSLTDLAGNPVPLYDTSFTVDSGKPTVTANLPSYAYNTAKTVKLTAEDNCDPDPVIYYTLNGANPTTSSTRYTTPLTITKTTTLKFMAVDSAGNVAAVQTRTYIIDKTPPTITADLETGVYTAKTVTLTATDNVDSYPEIYYTTNGNNPTTSSDVYISPIILFTTTTLKFIAVDYAGNICGVKTRIYTITGINATAPTVTANLKGGVYNTTKTVTLTASDDRDPNPVIYYTNDGSTPTTSSTRYTKPIHIAESTILKFTAMDNAGNVAGVQTRNYTINVAHLIIHGPVCWDYLGGVDPYNAFSDPDIFDSMDEDSFTELVVMARVAGYVSSLDTSRPTLENNIKQYMYGFALPRLQRGLELSWVYPSLYIDYVIPLNEPVTAVSVVIKQNNATTYDLQEKVEIWVNGQLKFTQKFFNHYSPAYSPYYHIDPYNLPIPILGVKENITISLEYPGGSIDKEEGVSYMNDIDTWADLDHPETGFEIIQSFVIAKTKITDNTIQSWLNKKSQYPKGYKKSIYGTFMTALNTLWLSDKIASEVSKNLNGTWSRNTSTTVMSGISQYGMAYVHCPDPAMGMKFIGNGQNVKVFRLVCSLMLSEVEHVTLGSAGNSVSSTLSKITLSILEGKTYKIIFNEDNTAIFTLEDDQRFKIIIDLETGLVKEIIDVDNFQYKGAETVNTGYCYHDQLTEDVSKHTKAFLDAFGWDGVESTGGGLLITAGLIAFGACPPLGALMVIGGLVLTADASGLTQDPLNPYNWLDFGVSTALSLAGPEGVTLKTAIQPAFRQTMKLTIKKDGYKTVARGTLGSNGRSAIKNCYNNYVTGSSISGLINMYRPENN